MPGHILATPVGGPYVVQVQLNPALVQIHDAPPIPIQRIAEVETGELWVFQLSANRPQTLEVTVTDLHEADMNGLQGFLNLVAFFQNTTNYSAVPFDCVHTDGFTTRVRYINGLESFREAAGISGIKGRWTGNLLLRKVL